MFNGNRSSLQLDLGFRIAKNLRGIKSDINVGYTVSDIRREEEMGFNL